MDEPTLDEGFLVDIGLGSVSDISPSLSPVTILSFDKSASMIPMLPSLRAIGYLGTFAIVAELCRMRTMKWYFCVVISGEEDRRISKRQT